MTERVPFGIQYPQDAQGSEARGIRMSLLIKVIPVSEATTLND